MALRGFSRQESAPWTCRSRAAVPSWTALTSDLQKYLFLSDLRGRNQTLFFAIVMSDPAGFMPLVYTPTVGEACQKFDHIFHAARGMYLPISARGRIQEILANWPQKDVRFIVVTDGERILGLGDLGVGGMGIPIGKLTLYTACAGVPPRCCLPVVLDVGTNNQELLADRFYLGSRQSRVRGVEYDAFVGEFVEAVRTLYPKCCIQWEDFANINAVPILERYRGAICTFNDDIQGTGAVALAGILAALRISGQKLADQRFLFLGAGSAALGMAQAISEAMTAGRNGRCGGPLPHRVVQHEGTRRQIPCRSQGVPEAVCSGSQWDPELPRRGEGTPANRHHRRQHRAETVRSASHRGNG